MKKMPWNLTRNLQRYVKMRFSSLNRLLNVPNLRRSFYSFIVINLEINDYTATNRAMTRFVFSTSKLEFKEASLSFHCRGMYVLQ